LARKVVYRTTIIVSRMKETERMLRFPLERRIFFLCFFYKIELFYIKFLRNFCEIPPSPRRHEILKSGDGKVPPPGSSSSSSSATAGSSEIDVERISTRQVDRKNIYMPT
jgi:hypothetical protein